MATLSSIRYNNDVATNSAGLDSAAVSTLTNEVSASITWYETLDSLPTSSLVSGTRAFVAENNRLYLTNGSGWYNVAFVNLSPTMSLDQSGTIVLSTEGVATTVRITAQDSDNPDEILSYSVESDGNGIGKYTLSQDSSVFTITPLTADSGATAGTFTLTFKTTDNINTALENLDFSLTFVTAVDSSTETVLLMKASGNSATNANITYQNSSDVSTGFTETGDPTASTFSPYRSGGYSAYFDGTGDYLSTSDASNAIGSGDFTVEAWVYITSLSSSIVIASSRVVSSSSNLYYALGVTTAGKAYFQTRASGGTEYLGETTDGTIEINKWYHIAGVRESNVNKIYVNGTVGSTTSNDGGLNLTEATIGVGFFNYPGYVYYMSGYIRDFRIVKGTAVYTSNFTPPTEALTAVSGTELLTCHLPYFGDGSTNNHSITVNGDAHSVPFGPYDYNPHITLSQSGYDSDIGSTYFNGSSYVYAGALGSEYTFGSGNFTVEAWYFPETLSSGADAVVTTADTNDRQGIWMGVNNDKMFVLTGQGTTWLSATSTASLVLNQWNHMAAVRNGNTVYGYLNGIQVLSYSETRTLTNTNNAIRIGGRSLSSQISNGYISDVRVIKGTAQYTAAFTPPSSRLQWVTNTVLQMQNVLDPRIYDVTSSNGVLAFGNAQTNTTIKKFTDTSSIYLDGSGDYLVVPRTEASWIGDGSDFTIEAWVYKSNSPALWTIYGQWAQIAGGYEQFILAGTSTWNFYWKPFSNGAAMLTSSTATSLNTWTHVAVTRQNDLFTLWVNGTSEDTYSTPLTDLAYSSANIDQAIGTYYDTGGQPGAGGYAQGYIQDLRVTKGKARYTTNFTPPTTEFEL